MNRSQEGRLTRTPMHCCEACFDDEFLKDYIRRKGKRGTCQYCRARGKYVIEAGELEPLFARFTGVYSPLQPGVNAPTDVDVLRGHRLATLIQDQWGIFSERLTESDKEHDLLQEIYTANCVEEEILDAPDVNDLWTDSDWFHTTLLDRWQELADELKHPEQHQPVAPGLMPTADDLATATDQLVWFEEDVSRACVTLAASSKIFRVRLGYREKEYSLVAIPVAEMGAPPPECVKVPGRANPVGVSYFYGAEDEGTAVAEKRPHRGALVSLAEGETLRDLRLIDLMAGMGLASPFECPGEYLRSLMESCELLNHLNKEFAKPLRHTDDTHEYRPTQFFAEWARDHGYDGLRYESAMSSAGRNVVFFDRGVVEMKSVRLVHTDEVKVSYSDYTGEDE